MRIFYDTEFIEDGSTIDLISIGMVTEDGREYYAVNADADWEKIRESDWLVRNVVPSLPVTGRTSLDAYVAHHPNHYPHPSISIVDIDRCDSNVKPHWVIRNEVRDFVLGTDSEMLPHIELWADYGAYDHVALCQLFGPMAALPEGMPMFTRDLQQEAARLGLKDADLPQQEVGHHNALADACHNQVIARFLDQHAAERDAGR